MNLKDTIDQMTRPKVAIPPNVGPVDDAPAEHPLFAQLDRHYRQLHAVLSTFQAPETMGQRLLALDANGTAQQEWKSEFRSIYIVNLTGATLTVAEGPRQTAAPGLGAGSAQVPAGAARVINLRGRVVSLYGAAAGLVDLSVYNRPQPPTFSAAGGSSSSGIPTVAAAAITTVNVTNVTTAVLAANAARQGVIITNEGPNAAFIAYAAAATVAAYTVDLVSGAYWEMPAPVFTGALSAICAAAGTATLRVTAL